MTTETYQQGSLTLLAQAREELATGDTRQASEKAWGAAALAIKAVCEERGWVHQSHRALLSAAAQFAREAEDPEMRQDFLSASALHTNFYEDEQEADMVQEGIHNVARFVDKLNQLLLAGPPH